MPAIGKGTTNRSQLAVLVELRLEANTEQVGVAKRNLVRKGGPVVGVEVLKRDLESEGLRWVSEVAPAEQQREAAWRRPDAGVAQLLDLPVSLGPMKTAFSPIRSSASGSRRKLDHLRPEMRMGVRDNPIVAEPEVGTNRAGGTSCCKRVAGPARLQSVASAVASFSGRMKVW